MDEEDALPFPDPPAPVAGPRLKDLLAQAGGAWRVVPGYFRSRPWRRGLMLSEYLSYRLHKRRGEARDHVGAYGAARIAFAINRGSGRRGLVGDKLLFDALLKGAGLPVPKLVAVFGRPAPARIQRVVDEDTLRRLVSEPDMLPLFCKPAQGQRSEDALSIARFDRVADCLIPVAGKPVSVPAMIQRLRRNHRGTGYLFQRFVRQHPEVEATVGETVATVRLITLVLRRNIHVIGAYWKVPRHGAVADNLWRGNLIAPINAKTGVVGAALAPFDPDASPVAVHPDSGRPLEGLELPRWPELLQIARRAAGLVQGLPLVGWDIALAEDGPMLIEANTSPSLELLQTATGKGLLTGEAGRLLKEAMVEADRARRNEARQRRKRRRRLIRTRLGIG